MYSICEKTFDFVHLLGACCSYVKVCCTLKSDFGINVFVYEEPK